MSKPSSLFPEADTPFIQLLALFSATLSAGYIADYYLHDLIIINLGPLTLQACGYATLIASVVLINLFVVRSFAALISLVPLSLSVALFCYTVTGYLNLPREVGDYCVALFSVCLYFASTILFSSKVHGYFFVSSIVGTMGLEFYYRYLTKELINDPSYLLWANILATIPLGALGHHIKQSKNPLLPLFSDGLVNVSYINYLSASLSLCSIFYWKVYCIEWVIGQIPSVIVIFRIIAVEKARNINDFFNSVSALYLIIYSVHLVCSFTKLPVIGVMWLVLGMSIGVLCITDAFMHEGKYFWARRNENHKKTN